MTICNVKKLTLFTYIFNGRKEREGGREGEPEREREIEG